MQQHLFQSKQLIDCALFFFAQANGNQISNLVIFLHRQLALTFQPNFIHQPVHVPFLHPTESKKASENISEPNPAGPWRASAPAAAPSPAAAHLNLAALLERQRLC